MNSKIYTVMVKKTAKHTSGTILGRSFSRNRQEYRAKSRGIEYDPSKYRPKNAWIEGDQGPEVVTNRKGVTYSLS